jgi:hypothetical protein
MQGEVGVFGGRRFGQSEEAGLFFNKRTAECFEKDQLITNQ